MAPKIDWKNDPDYIKLINFLIERTKDAKSPLRLNKLAEEFKENSGAPQSVGCLVGRVNCFRWRIHRLDSINTETKVKMIFGLSASVDRKFLEELRIDAHVKVDERNRIIKYKAKDGRLKED